VRYFHFCAQEQFPPDALLKQAGADPQGAVGFYGESALPALRGAPVS
jgi:hypothetical protein